MINKTKVNLIVFLLLNKRWVNFFKNILNKMLVYKKINSKTIIVWISYKVIIKLVLNEKQKNINV